MNRRSESDATAGESRSDQLVWLALRYYLDELPQEEAARFASRLEEDPQAQQALAEAVQLCLYVEAACQSVPARAGTTVGASTPGRSSAWWPALAMAAVVLVLALGVLRLGLPRRPAAPEPIPGHQQAAATWQGEAELVQTWVRLQPWSDDAETAAEQSGEELAEDALLAEAESDAMETAGEVEAAVPPWLLVALDAVGEQAGESMMTP